MIGREHDHLGARLVERLDEGTLAKLAPTIVKDTVPADGFGSTALVSQSKLLADAGNDVFTWNSFDLYGTNQDELVVWNSFLDGQLDVAAFTAALTQITDAVYNDPSVTKVVVE